MPDTSIDLILCDLPYQTTAHKWDVMIPTDPLWEQYHRILKPDGVVVLFATQPFTSILICSNLEEYRYNWIWEKESCVGHLNSSYKPLKKTEDICVFSRCTAAPGSKNPIRYYLHNIKDNGTRNNQKNNKTWSEFAGKQTVHDKLLTDTDYKSKTGFPCNILKYSRDKDRLHPAQKPVALLEFLIKTYTKENETVLDNCMGSGSTGVAAVNTKRQFIGMELDDHYFEIASNRINEAQASLR